MTLSHSGLLRKSRSWTQEPRLRILSKPETLREVAMTVQLALLRSFGPQGWLLRNSASFKMQISNERMRSSPLHELSSRRS